MICCQLHWPLKGEVLGPDTSADDENSYRDVNVGLSVCAQEA